MLIVAIPLFVCLLGAVLFFAGAGKWSQLGLEMFKWGLLVTLFVASGRQVLLK